nr:integrase, catalytic region, zinc finger, CCHC-type, peptidase aspartic, catalytic [Tanacetum cinerariifolium]
EEIDQNDDDNDLANELTAETLPPNKKSILKNTNVLAPGMYKLHTESNQTRTSQLPQDSWKTNKRVSFSTGVIPTTSVSRPQLKSNRMGDRVMRNNSQGKNQETLNVNSVCATCDTCVLNDKHDICVLHSVAKPIKKIVASESNQKPKNITRKLYERISKACSWWYPKFTPSGYKWKPKSGKENVNPNTSMPLGSVSRTANILEQMTSRVYYVEGLNHNLFFVGQFCDADLEVAFRKSICFIRDLKGNDLLIGVIPPTSVSRPQLKSNPIEDRGMLNNSQGKNTRCRRPSNGVNSRTKMPMAVPISTREPKRIVNQSVAKPLRRIVASESTNQKPKNTTRKLYEHVTKTCSWWYPKFIPPGYKWKPKSQIGNVNPKISMPLGNESRTANMLEPMTPRRSTVSNTKLYSNSFAARKDNPIHRRLWVLKTHDGKSQVSN